MTTTTTGTTKAAAPPRPAPPPAGRSSPRRAGLTEQAAWAGIDAACRTLHLPTIRAQAGDVVAAAERDQQTHAAVLAELLLAECDARDERARTRRVREAAFPRTKRLEDFDTTANPNINPATLAMLTTADWVATGAPLCLLGDSGTGKSHCETHGGGPAGLLGAGVPESVPVAATDSKVSLTRWPRPVVSSLWICRRGRRHRPGPPSLA